jgi:putative oxidoreductase
LLLRLGAGFPLIYFAIGGLYAALGDPFAMARYFVAVVGGILLAVGLWTPLVGSVVAVDELWIASSQAVSQQGNLWVHILFAVMSAALAMLGPGAWSVDAFFFGRKRFEIKDRTPVR